MNLKIVASVWFSGIHCRTNNVSMTSHQYTFYCWAFALLRWMGCKIMQITNIFIGLDQNNSWHNIHWSENYINCQVKPVSLQTVHILQNWIEGQGKILSKARFCETPFYDPNRLKSCLILPSFPPFSLLCFPINLTVLKKLFPILYPCILTPLRLSGCWIRFNVFLVSSECSLSLMSSPPSWTWWILAIASLVCKS